VNARPVQRRTAPVGASLLAIRGCPVRPHREQARSYRSGPHTAFLGVDGSHAPAWEPQCGRSAYARRSASPTAFPRGAWERLDARSVQRRTAPVGASLLAIRGCPVRPHREQARSYRSGPHTAFADGSHAPAWEPQCRGSERRSASPTAFPRGAWERSVLHACTKTPSPLVGDDRMDAGGRATQDAKAEGRGEGALPLPASRRSAPTAAGALA